MSEQPNLLPDLPKTSRRAHLITIGARAISLGWSRVAALEHLDGHLNQPISHHWCEVGCMARTMWHLNTKSNRERVRRQIPNMFRYALGRGLFLVIEYATGRGTHGEAIALKLYVRPDGAERQHAEHQLSRMLRRRELSQENYERARSLLD
jgi:hypothetical protein